MPCPELDLNDDSSNEELFLIFANAAAPLGMRRLASDLLLPRLYDQLKCYARNFFRLSSRAASNELAEDVVQEAFALALQNAGQFDPTRSLANWLRRVVHNQAINLRKRERRYQGLGGDGDAIPDRGSPPLDDVASREVLSRLNPDDRELFTAVFIDGETVKAVAGRRGEPPGNVYRALRGLKHRLRAAIAPAGDRRHEA